MNENEIKVVEEVAEGAAQHGLTNGQKVGVIAAATVLTGGLAYGVYRLVKHVKAKKAAKAQTETAE